MMLAAKLFVLILAFVSLAQEPFQSLENTVGYIVIEKGGKSENYIVTEDKNGTVKLIKTSKNPREFLKKADDGGKR